MGYECLLRQKLNSQLCTGKRNQGRVTHRLKKSVKGNMKWKDIDGRTLAEVPAKDLSKWRSVAQP